MQSGRSLYKNLTLFVQSQRCSCKVLNKERGKGNFDTETASYWLAQRLGDDNIFLSFLQCEKTKECLNDIKENMTEAFKKASELIAALKT